MTDLGCFFLAAGFAIGCWFIGSALRASARSFGDSVDIGTERIYAALEGGVDRVVDEMRYRTRVAGGLTRRKEPTPPPLDKDTEEAMSFIAGLAISDEEKDDLVGGYELVTGKRHGAEAVRAMYLNRLRVAGVPLPGLTARS